MKDRVLVQIEWGDAWVDCADYELVKAKKLKPVPRTTVGWLIEENEECIVLCTDLFDKDKDYVNTVMIIPTGMITAYWKYEELVSEPINDKRIL